ncbi:hypothetical protein OF83DRAFT_1059068 [Amylostereum chailletii]|nr:hypothetical protein OF83DRAFT_1059068 [Amylostereum chailletii]
MSSTDTTVLSAIGYDIVQNGVCIAVESFLLAVYAILAGKAGHIFIRKGFTKISVSILAAITIMFVLATVNWIIDLVNFVSEARMTLVDGPGGDLETKYNNALTRIFHFTSIQAMLYSYMSNIGDAVIIWRVYAFWSIGREKFVVILPCLSLLASVIASILMTYCVAHSSSETEALGIFQKPAFCRNIQITTYCTAVITTAVATFLIGLKAWMYRRSIKATLFESTRRTKVEKVAAILVETGLLYFLFFVLQLLMSIPGLSQRLQAKSGSRFAFTMVEYLTSVVAGIYPTGITVLVHSKKSLLPSTWSTITTTTCPNGEEANIPIGFANNETVWGSRAGSRQYADIQLGDMHSLSHSNTSQKESE